MYTVQKVMYTVHSNTIYPWFLSMTKPKLAGYRITVRVRVRSFD